VGETDGYNAQNGVFEYSYFDFSYQTNGTAARRRLPPAESSPAFPVPGAEATIGKRELERADLYLQDVLV